MYLPQPSHRIARFLDRTIGPRCDRSAIFSTISSSGRMPLSISIRVVAVSRTIGEYRWQDPSQEIVRLVVDINDRCTINRDAGDRWYDQSIVAHCEPIVRALVISCDRAYEKSCHPKTDGRPKINRTINRRIVRPIVRSIVATYDRSYDHSWYQTIGNRRLQVLNMTIDLVATDLSFAITHDLCNQSYVLSTICPRFQKMSVACRS